MNSIVDMLKMNAKMFWVKRKQKLDYFNFNHSNISEKSI